MGIWIIHLLGFIFAPFIFLFTVAAHLIWTVCSWTVKMCVLCIKLVYYTIRLPFYAIYKSIKAK